MSIKIYIYNLVELNELMLYYPEVPVEMNLYSLFYNQLLNNYTIVNDINCADIAFIPIDYTKILYRYPNNYKHLPLDFPPNPPTFGIKYKQNNIKYFWNNYVNNYLIKTTTIPHFMLFSYVLFDINFNTIPNNIIIIAYETKVSLYNIKYAIKNSNHNIVMIPYILNKNEEYNQSKITQSLNSSNSNSNSNSNSSSNSNNSINRTIRNNIIINKKIEIGFFGDISDTINRPILTYYRKIINILNSTNFSNYIINKGKYTEKYLPYIKYLFVLRGDTPTRLCFYQCFAFGVIPILYEDDFKHYNNLIVSVNLVDSVFIIPNKSDTITEEIYNSTIINMLQNELSNNDNYLTKVKNHKHIFDEFNYFTTPLCKPIENIIKKIKNN
jgi:hypothetical protein